MKKLIVVIMLGVVVTQGVWANQTRMNTLMAGDYIDDPIYIDIYPQFLVDYENSMYGDITRQIEDYGIVISAFRKYGAFGFWHDIERDTIFKLGYALTLNNFHIGISGSPVQEHQQIGIGIGRMFFNHQCDLSFLMGDDGPGEWYNLNVRCKNRRGDFVIVPKYALEYVRQPMDYKRHRLGFMLQRLVLNDGFVYAIGEYEFYRGDLDSDLTNISAGLELPLNRRLVLRCGAIEQFMDGFESPTWQLEAGFGVRVREFNIDFHFNGDKLFSEYFTLFVFNSFGLDVNFGRF